MDYGTVDKRDRKSLAKYQAIIEECNNKRLETQQKPKPTDLKRNQSQSKRNRLCKGSGANQLLQPVRKQRPTEEAWTMSHMMRFSENRSATSGCYILID